jgi:hypothetical protein
MLRQHTADIDRDFRISDLKLALAMLTGVQHALALGTGWSARLGFVYVQVLVDMIFQRPLTP